MKCIERLWLSLNLAALRLIFNIHFFSICDKIYLKKMEVFTMNNHIAELRNKYLQHPPEGMTKKDIKEMSDNDLLDMDYFLHEDDDLDDDNLENFFIF